MQGVKGSNPLRDTTKTCMYQSDNYRDCPSSQAGKEIHQYRSGQRLDDALIDVVPDVPPEHEVA